MHADEFKKITSDNFLKVRNRTDGLVNIQYTCLKLISQIINRNGRNIMKAIDKVSDMVHHAVDSASDKSFQVADKNC